MAIPSNSTLALKKHFRLHRMIGDAMAPTFKSGDFIIIATVDAYHGEGVYLIDDGLGISVYRCMKAGSEMRLMLDNPAYTAQSVDRAWFDERVIAKAIAGVNVIDRSLMEAV